MPKINCNMLETARLMRKYTQKEVSEYLGISQGKLSKAEQGLQELPQNVFEKLLLFYDFPEKFFYVEQDYSPSGHLYFRRKLTISSRVIEAFIATTRVFKMAVDEIMTSVELPDCDIKQYSTDDFTPEEIAQKIRYQLQCYRGPIPNLTTLLENHGIIIAKINFGTDKLDGLSTITNRGHKIIFLNSQMPNDRQRYSLAHELGHMVMHLCQVPSILENTEIEADQFASEFLLPKDEIRESLRNLNISTLAELKRRWRVSMRSLIRRAKNLEELTYDDYRKYQIIFSKNGYNKNEPVSIPIERPSVISSVIDLYKNELGYSDEDIMNVMLLNGSDYKSFFMCTNTPIIQLKPYSYILPKQQ